MALHIEISWLHIIRSSRWGSSFWLSWVVCTTSVSLDMAWERCCCFFWIP